MAQKVDRGRQRGNLRRQHSNMLHERSEFAIAQHSAMTKPGASFTQADPIVAWADADDVALLDGRGELLIDVVAHEVPRGHSERLRKPAWPIL